MTFVDPRKVKHKRDPGRCYKHAGFKLVGKTKGDLLAWQLLPELMPEPMAPIGASLRLFRDVTPPQ